MANLSNGLIQIVQINGVGLVTRGFLWQGPEIWFDAQAVDGVATGWTASAGYSGCVSASLVSTSWSAAAGYSGASASSLISTTWVFSQTFGDEFPA